MAIKIKSLFSRQESIKLFWVSFFILFLELTVIRFIPAQIRYVSYFTNIILLAAFVGIGWGTMSSVRVKLPLIFIPGSICLFQLLTYFMRYDLQVFSNQITYFTSSANPIKIEPIFLLPFIFFGVVCLFFLPAKIMGQLLNSQKPLKAYTINILGSLLGILAFSFLSFIDSGPIVWFPIILVVSIFATGLPRKRATLFLLVLFFIASFIVELPRPNMGKTVWSPYYKINLFQIEKNHYYLTANNISHQYMADLPTLKEDPFYHYPYDLIPEKSFDQVLIIGAGAGNDVAQAIASGAKEVTAVEIDPLIIRLGKQYHPEKPYDSNKVHIIIDDGRHFLTNNRQKYDLIIFALTDSLTLTSAAANLRLESYLFTLESFQAAKTLLKQDGMVVLYNFYRQPWLVDKLTKMMATAFEKKPHVTSIPTGLGPAAIIINNQGSAELPPSDYQPQNENIAIPTDNWPFLYLKEKGIPSFYWTYLGAIFLITTIATSLIIKKQKTKLDWPFFWLGAAFMLLETKNVVQFSLLFGSTWLTNAFVFSGLLALVLVAIWVVQRFGSKLKIKPLYFLLFILIAFGYFFPQQTLLKLDSLPRLISAILLNFSPVFIANIVFAKLFGQTKRASRAFGANLLGSFIGGISEYTSMAFGYGNLMILVGLFYFLSFFTAKRS